MKKIAQLAARLSKEEKREIFRQKGLLINSSQKIGGNIEPLDDYGLYDDPEHLRLGLEVIADGEVGCLIAAGGQGTRLKFAGPKGIFPITGEGGKSLFQLFTEKTFFAGKRAGRKLPLAIMTSQGDLKRVRKFFSRNNFFGLDKEQLFFFAQSERFLLDESGGLFLDRFGKLAKGPDGNGSSLRSFVKEGLWRKFWDKGVRYLNFILVDNALADPFDPYLLGFQKKMAADVAIKCCRRNHPQERAGVLVRVDGRPQVIEYFEFPQGEDIERYTLINLSLFSFTLEFIKRVENIELPLHPAHKTNSFMGADGRIINPFEPNSWKFEEFIFDLLPYAKKARALLYPREICFAPLKNAEGPDSVETMRKALLKRERQLFREITGREAEDDDLELSQEFYYPTDKLISKWRNGK